jgi:hypothetical protein
MKTNKRNKINNNEDGMNMDIVNVPKSLRYRGVIMPQSFTTHLKYMPTANLVAVGDTASRQFNANGLYDVDPAFGSTAVSGFAELMAFYVRYRVKKVRISADFINLDTHPTVCNVGFENVNIAVKNYPYFSESNQKTRLIAGTGGNPVRLVKEMDLAKLKGDNVVLNDNDYTGTVSTNPANLLYVSMAISDPSAAAMTLGAYVRAEIVFEAEFFSLKNLNL